MIEQIEDIKECLELSIDNGISMLPEDLLRVLNYIRAQESAIENLQGRIDALNDTNRMLIRSQDSFAKSEVMEFAHELQKYYTYLHGVAYPPMIHYHIQVKLEEFIKKKYQRGDHDYDC